MSGLPPKVLPFGPLAALLERRNRACAPLEGDQPVVVYDAEWVGRVIGAERRLSARRRAQRAKAEGLTVWEADRLAIALGWMPWCIWGDAWWTARGTWREDSADGAFRVLRVNAREAA